MDIENCWEAVPVIVNDSPRWLLRKIHKEVGKLYRDSHGHFASLDELQAAVDHLESEPVRIAAKEKA